MERDRYRNERELMKMLKLTSNSSKFFFSPLIIRSYLLFSKERKREKERVNEGVETNTVTHVTYVRW